MTKVLQILFATLSLLIVGFLLVCFVLGADGTSSWLGFDILHVAVERHGRIYAFSVVDKLPIILFVASFFSFILLWGAYKVDSFVRSIKDACRFLLSYCKDTFYLVKASKVKIFLLIPFLAGLYFAMYYPVTLDEPQTYYDFIKPPFWEALALYPYPNNHVLSSLLSNITNEIPGLDLLFRLRLPVVLISLLTWVFAYRFVRKFYTENLALFVVAIGSVVETNLQHAYIARGYAYVMFFVVIGIYAAFNIIQGGNRKRDWLAFVFSSALGAWAMPSYLYPFLSISIFIFIFKYKEFKLQLFYSILVGVFVFVLYSPILVFTGLDGLTSNEFVTTIDRIFVMRSLPQFMLGTAVHIFYVPPYPLLGAFALILLYTLYKRDRNTLILWAVFGLTPSLFLVVHSVLPFFRTFFYYGFLFVFMIAVSFKDVIAQQASKTLYNALVIIHLALLTFFCYTSRDLMSDVYISSDLRQEILEDGKSYYFHTGIPYLEEMNATFEVERRNWTSIIEFGSEGDVAKLPRYDYYIMEENADITSVYTPSLQTKSVFSRPINVYKWTDMNK